MIAIAIISLCIFGSIVLLTIVYFRTKQLKQEEKAISKRLEFWLSEKSKTGQTEEYTKERVDKDETFTKRVLIPIGEQVGKWMAEKVPYHKQSVARKELIKAGYREKKALPIFYSIKITLGIAVAIGSLFLMSLYVKEAQQGFVTIMIGGISGFLGFRFPNIFLDKKIAERQLNIDRVLPDALDLLVICTEAGMGIDQSLLRVAANLGSKGQELREEILITNREMNLGVERSQCWNNMGERTKSEELRNLSRVISQSEKVGASVATVLRSQSEFLRVRRRQKAEEVAAQMSIKMMLPLGLFIFPCIMAVTMGPPILKIISTFSATAK